MDQDSSTTAELEAQPTADSGVTVNTNGESPRDFEATGDFTPPTPTASAIPGQIVAIATQDSDTEADSEPNRTVSLGPSDLNRTASLGATETDRTVSLSPTETDRTVSLGATETDRTVSLSPTETDRTVSVAGSSSPSKVSSPTRSGNDGPSIPGYEILGTLGRGGMGVVYKARQSGLNRLVALKMIIGGSHAGSRQLARFRIEAEAVAQLKHPNIVQIYDIGEVDDMPYVSLELLEGGDLDDRLAGTPQPGVQAAELMATLARAVHAAHQARIVHRDLKPANVLLTADGVPKITDFGLAKRLESDDNQTNSGDIMGTPSYMAPEQAMGRTKDVGPAADIYALGAILYEVLTGRPPLKGETVIETVRMVVHEEPVPPSRLVPRLARDLETICLKCLYKAPEQRYATAEELAEDLDRYREGKPIKARPISLFGRAIKWSRRHPVAAASLILGVLAFLSLGAGFMIHQERRNSWVLEQNNVAMELLDRDVKSRSADTLRQDQVDMATFLKEIGTEPRLQRISLRIAAKQKSVEERFQELSSNAAAEQRARADRERFAKFQGLDQEAQLYAAGFAVLDETDRLAKLSASAHAALATYAQDPQASDDAWTLANPLPAALQETEKARVADACYDLLLIRSQAATPDVGLRILDRAVHLRPKPTAAYHRRRADCLERAGDLAGRDREIREAGLIDPLTPLDYFLNGRELFLRRRFADAVRPLQSALQADPNQISAHLLLAVCYINMQPKRLGQARTSLDACIGKHGDLVGLYLMRAFVSGQESNQALETLAQSRPDEEEAARLRQDAKDAIAAAEADYRKALEALDLKPDDNLRYSLLTNRGLMWLQSNRLDDAVVDLEAAIRLKPGLYQAHGMLAKVYERQGRLDAAAASLTRGIDCHPEPIVLAGLYRSRALLRAYRSDITPDQRKSALRDLEETIRLEPDKALKVRDHVDRAKLFFASGQAQEAMTACDAALAIIPDDAEAHRVRISSLMELKRYDEVLTSTDAYIAARQGVGRDLRNPRPGPRGEEGLRRGQRRLQQGARSDPGRGDGPAHPALEPPRLGLPFRLGAQAGPRRLRAVPTIGSQPERRPGRPGVGPDPPGQLASRGVRRRGRGQARHGLGPATEEERKARSQALFNAARVYAMAVEFAAKDVSRQGERAVVLYRKYRSRALNLLDEALKYAPDREYRDAILNEPALRSLRQGTSRGPGLRFGSYGIGNHLMPSTS